MHTPNARIIKARVMIRHCNERYVIRSIDRFVEWDKVVHFRFVEPFYKNTHTAVQEVSLTHMDETSGYSLMKILLNIPTAANVIQDATFQNICRFLSLGKTQSMLYSFFTTMFGCSVLHQIWIFVQKYQFARPSFWSRVTGCMHVPRGHRSSICRRVHCSPSG